MLRFRKVQFSSSLDLSEIGIHRGGKAWAAPPPSRRWVRDGVVVRHDDGKPRWQPIVSFMNHGTMTSWSRQILAVMRAKYLRLLPANAE